MSNIGIDVATNSKISAYRKITAIVQPVDQHSPKLIAMLKPWCETHSVHENNVGTISKMTAAAILNSGKSLPFLDHLTNFQQNLWYICQ